MTNNSPLLSRLLNWNKKSAPETVDAEQYAEAFGQFKKLLLEQYQIRIQAKTAKRLPINLTAKPTHFGTSPERAALYFDDLTIESEDIATEIDKILNTHQRLLLIGDPGAGKTTILLFAAINILQAGNLGGNLKLPPKLDALPLILNLATWQKNRDFKEWYAQSIAHTYSLSPVFVEELLRRNAVVPFFDGFDEVAEDAREDCFQKMAAYFGDQRSRQLIVSSRKKEYAAAKTDAPVYTEIEVEPLSLMQIQKALFENSQTYKSDLALLFALDRDEHLAKAVETPFYLNTASFLFAKSERTIFDFAFKKNSVEGRQEELVQVFVNEQVPELKDRNYLSFLSKKMEEKNFLVFELVKMQPEWCENLWRYWLIFILVFGLIASWIISLVFELTISIIAGFVTGLIICLDKYSIRTKDIQVWHPPKNIKNWMLGIASGLLGGLLGSIVGFLISILISILFLDFGSDELGIYIGWVPGLVIGLTVGFKGAGTATNFLLLHISSPYKRFWASFWGSFWTIWVFLFTIFGILVSSILEKGLSWEQLTTLVQNMTVWSILPFGLIFFIFPFWGSKFFEHFALRLVLYLENKLPLRLVTFLDRMTDQHIFEDNRRTINGKKQRGATWRFRHKILQDYFAGHP